MPEPLEEEADLAVGLLVALGEGVDVEVGVVEGGLVEGFGPEADAVARDEELGAAAVEEEGRELAEVVLDPAPVV